MTLQPCPPATPSTLVDNGDGSFTHTGGDGTPTTIPICDLIDDLPATGDTPNDGTTGERLLGVDDTGACVLFDPPAGGGSSFDVGDCDGDTGAVTDGGLVRVFSDGTTADGTPDGLAAPAINVPGLVGTDIELPVSRVYQQAASGFNFFRPNQGVTTPLPPGDYDWKTWAHPGTFKRDTEVHATYHVEYSEQQLDQVGAIIAWYMEFLLNGVVVDVDTQAIFRTTQQRGGDLNGNQSQEQFTSVFGFTVPAGTVNPTFGIRVRILTNTLGDDTVNTHAQAISQLNESYIIYSVHHG